jgi:hypothetical protein
VAKSALKIEKKEAEEGEHDRVRNPASMSTLHGSSGVRTDEFSGVLAMKRDALAAVPEGKGVGRKDAQVSHAVCDALGHGEERAVLLDLRVREVASAPRRGGG